MHLRASPCFRSGRKPRLVIFSLLCILTPHHMSFFKVSSLFPVYSFRGGPKDSDLEKTATDATILALLARTEKTLLAFTAGCFSVLWPESTGQEVTESHLSWGPTKKLAKKFLLSTLCWFSLNWFFTLRQNSHNIMGSELIISLGLVVDLES